MKLRRFNNLSLSRKFYLYLLFFIIIPLLVSAYIINNNASELLSRKSNETALQTLKQSRFNLNKMVSDTEYLSLRLLSDDNLQDLINYDKNESFKEINNGAFPNFLHRQDNPQNILNYYSGTVLENNDKYKIGFAISMQPLLRAMTYVDSFAVSNGDKIIFQYGDMVSKEDTMFQEKAQSLGGIGFWTTSYDLKYSTLDPSKKVISYIRQIRDLSSMEPIGTERISIDEDTFTGMYQGSNLWKNGSISIINHNGVTISSTDKSLLGSNLTHEGYISKALAGKEGYFQSKINGIKYAVFYYTVEQTDWLVVQIVPASELFVELNASNLLIFLCISFCLLFGIIFSIVQNSTILKPLKLLSREMNKVKIGEFNVHLPIRSDDEIGNVQRNFLRMVEQLKELINEVYIGHIKKKEAELSALQTQINPHFLYNTLENIRWMSVNEGATKTGEQIEALSRMFRHVLNNGEEITSIQNELDHLRNYIFIQENRFQDNIVFNIQSDERLMDCQIMKLLLQPLVENAVHHGLQRKVGGGYVNISIRQEGENLTLIVEDNGLGADETRVRQILASGVDEQEGFALKNINDRIQLKYGNRYGLEFSSKKNVGTKVMIIIPLIFNGKGERHEAFDC